MWFIDLHHDLEWTNKNQLKENLKVTWKCQVQSYPNLELTIFIYGTEWEVKHIRIVGNFKDKEEVEKFINSKIGVILTSLEVFISLVQQFPFKFKRVFQTTSVFLSHGEYKEHEPPLRLETSSKPRSKFNYELLKQVLSVQFPSLEDYLFYLQKALDTNQELDYRWVNYYKIFEFKFNSSGKGLDKSQKWRDFLEDFKTDLKKYLKGNQRVSGLMEEWRTFAFHSIARGGKRNFGIDRKANAILLETLPILEKMAQKIINELPENKGRIQLFQIKKTNLS